MTACVFDPADALGAEWREGRWIGRIDRGEGPCPVLVVRAACAWSATTPT